MKIARCVVAGIGVGLCFCTIAKADDDQISNLGTVRGPVVIKRIIVVRTHGGRMVYVRPAYSPIHSSVPVNRSSYSATAAQGHRQSVELSDSGDTDDHGAKTVKTGHRVDTNQAAQQADKDSKSADRKPEVKQAEAKQPEAKHLEANQSEDASALDRLTVQAQKEQAILPAEPGGIEPK